MDQERFLFNRERQGGNQLSLVFAIFSLYVFCLFKAQKQIIHCKFIFLLYFEWFYLLLAWRQIPLDCERVGLYTFILFPGSNFSSCFGSKRILSSSYLHIRPQLGIWRICSNLRKITLYLDHILVVSRTADPTLYFYNERWLVQVFSVSWTCMSALEKFNLGIKIYFWKIQICRRNKSIDKSIKLYLVQKNSRIFKIMFLKLWIIYI